METLEILTLTDCNGLQFVTGADLAALATIMKLKMLDISDESHWTAGGVLSFVGSFVGSNISQTLENFSMKVHIDGDGLARIVDDVQVATALASCRNLKSLHVSCGYDDGCVFGRNGLDGLQAMATGCPLLANFTLYLTVPAIHYLATRCANLTSCGVIKSHADAPRVVPKGFPSTNELCALYPTTSWWYCSY